jgi:hypothetical protein
VIVRRLLLTAAVALATTSLAPAVDPAAQRVTLAGETKPAKPAKKTKPATPAKKPSTAAAGTKRNDGESTSGKGTLDPIGVLTRGQTIELRGTVLRTGQTCGLKVSYADGTAKRIKNVTPDTRKHCTFTVTVPETSGVVGAGKAVLTIKKQTGALQRSVRQNFVVQ